MAINFTFKTLIVAALFSGCISAATAISTATSAPEVSEADAKVSFWDMSFLDNAYIETSPGIRNDKIAVGTLGVDGGKKEPIVKLAKAIAQNQFGLYDSLLITHKNRLIFESYYNRGRVNLPQFQFSATKTYIALAIGRAIQMGYLKMEDLHTPITHFFDDLDVKALADGTDQITLHHAMTMCSGISVSQERRTQIMNSISLSKGTKGVNAVQAFLQHTAAITPASQTLVYKDADPLLTMSILEAVVPGTAEDFINNELLAKIGITDFRWNKDINGLPTGNGAFITPRNMLKIGALILSNGSWQGDQLIAEGYLEKATSGIAQHNETWIPKHYQYGYFMYQIDVPAGERSFHANLAWGAGGQRILIVNELDLVVVVTGHDEEDNTIMPNLVRAILTAFAKSPTA